MEVGLCSVRETPHTPVAHHLQLSENVHTKDFLTSAEGIAIITVDHQDRDFLKNPLKQEESEDEGFPYEGTSNSVSRVTPSDQLDEGFQMQELKKEEPEDDEYLYCEDCSLFFINKCEVHGPAVFIPDTRVPLGVPYRAKQTLPPGLVVQESSIPDAGLGVFNMGETVPVGVYFGPYQGDLVDCDEAMNSGYSWVVYRGDQCEQYIDGRREIHANWMRFVNCSCDNEQKNLVAFQYHGGIFYRSCRPIRPGQELLVWYTKEYAKNLSIAFGYIWKKKCSASVAINKSEYTMTIQTNWKRQLQVSVLHPIPTSLITKFKKRVNCLDCGRSFTRQSNVILYQCIHTREKAFFYTVWREIY
ncbi:hypothetical protein QTP86_034756 [Hemibagrus guttatus]|nr:hypothetical protein QTP86_034756 [Hemibagrus guttatus]